MLSKTRRSVSLLACALVYVIAGSGAAQAPPQPTHNGAMHQQVHAQVNPTEGVSWLEHLGRHMGESSMGWTGLWGPSPIQEQGAAPFNLSVPPEGSLTISGQDIFRFSCRACHGERGEGAPPEINSMIAPVQSTSTDLILARMKKSGAPVSMTVARQLAEQSKSLLLNRIGHGGVNMPAFPQLTPLEVQALVNYLDLLVGIPGSQSKQMTLLDPVDHVGEDLVKGTCHICHAATGQNPTPEELLQGAIPPLSALTKRLDVQQFVQKVTIGRPILMGDIGMKYRGRMPVFYYIKPDEAAAAYLYLRHYPPK